MKLMKKISVFVFAMVMFVSMIGGASAYTQNVTIDQTNIDIAFAQNNTTPYVAIKVLIPQLIQMLLHGKTIMNKIRVF